MMIPVVILVKEPRHRQNAAPVVRVELIANGGYAVCRRVLDGIYSDAASFIS
jgi:hypothetical protein